MVHNVDANHDVTIEVANRAGRRPAAVVADGAERDRLWEQHVAKLPNFADYPKQTGRLIPTIRIMPPREG